MIGIKCENPFLYEKLHSLFKQKKLILEKGNSDKFFFQLKFTQGDNLLSCQIDEEIIKFKIPRSFNDILDKIFDSISKKHIHINDFKYYPYKQIMKNSKNSILLSQIQNTILCHLLLNLENGIEKLVLIKNIWPNDKDIFLNKLDTHLTNLKNQLAKEIGFELNFSSKLGILKLCID